MSYREEDEGTAKLSREGYTSHDEQRWAPENRKSPSRTAFERDRARIIHSSALRRLGEKTQVQAAGTDDFARTRLTHTLEVAQIGRQIGELLGCDPDVVDCACLAHDLGHPPFGHTGERELADIAQNIGGFEGNAQTFRLLTRLEPKVFFPEQGEHSAGLNLTRACLDAAVKYPWTKARTARHPKGEGGTKFCIYPDDQPAFDWLTSGVAEEVGDFDRRPMECQVMDLADDIAYSVHDVEDGIVMGTIDARAIGSQWGRDDIVAATRRWYGENYSADLLSHALETLDENNLLPSEFSGSRRDLAVLKNRTSTLIGRFATAVEKATREQWGAGALTRYRANLVIPEQTAYEILALKGISVYFVMAPRDESPLEAHERHIIRRLVDALMQDSPRPSPLLSPAFRLDWKQAISDDERLRVAVDQVASLTDVSARRLVTKLGN